MLEANQVVLDPDATADAEVTLTYDSRKRSRLRTRLDPGADGSAGEELIILVPRNTVLADGDLVRTSAGTLVRVRAAAETLSTVRTGGALAMARACYHLGNRHVPVEIGAGYVRYQHDHVLDDMIRHLGLTVSVERAPFQPEPGAYGGGHHHHGHEHSEHSGHQHSGHQHPHES